MTDRYALREAALKVLTDLGPLTAYRLAFQLDAEEKNVYRALRRAHSASPKLVYIKQYKRNDEPGMKAHWIIVWAVGDEQDAKKPGKMSKKLNSKRYYAKNKAIINLRATLKYNKAKNPTNDPFAFVVNQLGRKTK